MVVVSQYMKKNLIIVKFYYHTNEEPSPFGKAVSSVYGYFFLAFCLKQRRHGKNLNTEVAVRVQLAVRLLKIRVKLLCRCPDAFLWGTHGLFFKSHVLLG